jgi:DNA-binding transcriptional MerR regulator
VPPPKLVPTGVAAQAIGVDVRTLQRWAAEGLVTPALTTPGGHLRWDVDDLMAQLRAKRQRDE